MTKRTISLSRHFEVGPRSAEPASSFDITSELKQPGRFIISGLGIGFFAVLMLLPVGLLALPLIIWFLRFLGI